MAVPIFRPPVKRLLVITHRLPFPPDKGERVRAYHQIAALSEHFEITLATLAHSAGDKAAVEGIAPFCRKVLVARAPGRWGLLGGLPGLLTGRSVTEAYFHSGRLARRVAAEAQREPFDLVLACSSAMLPCALAAAAPARAIDLVDADSAKWDQYADQARPPMRWLYRREARAVEALERLAARRCEALFVVTRPEADALPTGRDKTVVVQNGVDCDYFDPAKVLPTDLGPAGLVFTGTMNYRPNARGVCWFVRNVWAEVRRRRPDATFTIVGRDPTAPVRRLARQPGVTVTGAVPDVRPYLAGASLAVCPLHLARGVQNKLLEAMAMARPTVASAPAIEGLDVEVGTHLLRADSPGQWQEKVLNLLDDAEVRRRIGQEARRHVREQYPWPVRLGPLIATCRRLAGLPEAPPAAGAPAAQHPPAPADRRRNP